MGTSPATQPSSKGPKVNPPVPKCSTKCLNQAPTLSSSSSCSSSTDGTLDEDPLNISFGSSSTVTTTTTSTTDIKCSTSSSTAAAEDGASAWRCPPLAMSDLRFLRRLGSGDIGSVYLVEMKVSGAVFAAKVMDKRELVRRNKVGRARTEKEILEAVSHPFLPRLHAAIESGRWSCLVTEFCPGGDLHVLRQLQPAKRFDEAAARFYAAEVVVALEYVHMLGIVYRDLKPENVLVRSDGHIMLTDFDLSLRCDAPTSATFLLSGPSSGPKFGSDQRRFPATSCILPGCIVPAVSCFHPMRRWKKRSTKKSVPDVVAEPADVRSMSFVGTHEYLAPEIISGDGHGSAVDWWTLGIFVFELLYGVTPFRGADHESTLANIIARALELPTGDAAGSVSNAAREFIAALLVKEPEKRLGSTLGAAAVKRHPFFDGVNWALLRCATPPYVPPPPSASRAADNAAKDSSSDSNVPYF
ncbi:Serine/threonine-protein kinase [Nymphaea thermarum]|nr:Serine/threonine-protein kinase [Nymphaea thermarum]